MRPWSECPEQDLKHIRGLCFDIDGTFTTQGKVTAEAFAMLWSLHQAGYKLIPITGRAAGHGDLMLRFWPVDAVISESGALIYYVQDGKRQTLVADEKAWHSPQIMQELLPSFKAKFSEAQLALDQDFRQYDLAIDIGEGVSPWSPGRIQEALAFIQQAGFQASASSVHINIWRGDISKPGMFAKWMQQQGQKLDLTEWIYLGDAANDAAAFAFFQQTVAVANFKKYQDQVKTLPQYITTQEMGMGFREVGARLLAARNRP
jgi:hypothetical protein